MTRRLTAALAAGAVIVLGGGLAAGADAATKNRITAAGEAKVKINESSSETFHFAPDVLTVKSGATVTFRNGPGGAPHSLSLLSKPALPKTLAQIFECPACGPLFAAHQVNTDTGEPAVPLVEVGGTGFDTPGNATTAGDSIFLPPGPGKVSFKVTAAKGKTLHYFCIIHPWMQADIKVR